MQVRHRIGTTEFIRQCCLSSTTLWRLQKTDDTFPKPIFIRNKKLYYQDEVTTWIEAQEKTELTHNNIIPKAQVSA